MLGHGFGHPQVRRACQAKYWSCGVVATQNIGDNIGDNVEDTVENNVDGVGDRGAAESKADAAESKADADAASKAAEGSVAFEVWEPRAERPEATRRQVSAQRVAAQLLGKLREDALSGSGKNVTGAVIAVPATATPAEIEAVKAAAREAGFEDVTTIGADVAVALAHGFDKVPQDGEEAAPAAPEEASAATAEADSKEAKDAPPPASAATALAPTKPARRILVLDIGACSATASILLCSNGILQSVTPPVTEWGRGGWFIDDALVQLCAKQFQRQSRLDATGSRRSLAKLRRACEKAKQSLSSAKESTISIEALCEGVDFRFRLNRSRFEAECASAITDTLSPVEAALRNAGLTAADIDEAVMAGGSARIPKLQRAFAFKLNRVAPEDGAAAEDAAVAGAAVIDPSETVAMGAAIHAAQLYAASGALQMPARAEGGGDPLAAPALAQALSLEVAGGAAVPIVSASALLPLRVVFRAAASLDGSFSLSLLEGGSPLAKDNSRLLELSQAAVGEISEASGNVAPTVQVEICVGADSAVQVTATFLAITPAEWDEEGENVTVPESVRATGPVLKGTCVLSGKKSPKNAGADGDDVRAKIVSLRDALSALDGAMEKALSPSETADLEDEDVETIQGAASQARSLMVGVTRPSIAQWETCEALQAQIEAVQAAQQQFDAALQEVLSAYEEEAEDDEAEDDDDEERGANDIDVDVDSDMD